MQTNTEFSTSLFHYTDAAGLLGILENKKLWATDSSFLNDAEELRYAASLLSRYIESMAATSPTDQIELQNFAAEIQRQFIDHPAAEVPPEFVPYVVSFCDDGDLLSMWRAYGKAGGFAIEFDANILLSSFEDSSSETQDSSFLTENSFLIGELTRVDYGNAPTPSMLNAISSFRESSKHSDSVTSFTWGLAEHLARAKHSAFIEEKETRLIVRAPACWGPPPKIRAADKHLIPYQETTFSWEAIRSIRVGPGPYQARNQSVLERSGLPDPRGGHQPQIYCSSIPLV